MLPTTSSGIVYPIPNVEEECGSSLRHFSAALARVSIISNSVWGRSRSPRATTGLHGAPKMPSPLADVLVTCPAAEDYVGHRER